MRSALVVVAAALAASSLPARAEEPLFLRIQPTDAVSGVAAGYGDASAARARREAVWARSDARARIAIASVCTGCMKPMPPARVLPPHRHDATEIVMNSDATTVADAIEANKPVPSDASAPPALLLATAGPP